MQNNSKLNLLIKTFFVIILGSIAFGFVFDLFKGGSSMDNMGNMGNAWNSGYSFNNFFNGLIGLLFNLLMVALIIAVFVALGIWIKNTFFKNTNFKALPIFNDPLVKPIIIIFGALLGLIVLFGILQGTFGYSYSSYNLALSLYGLISLLIKVITVVLIISIILALAVYVKKQFEAGAFSQSQKPGTNNNLEQDKDKTPPIERK